MSFALKNRTTPLFVNSSQVQKYGCSPRVSAAVISDRDADQWNNFRRFSPLPSMDVAAKQSKNCTNDIESHRKPDCKPYVSNSISPVFNRQRLLKSLGSGQNSPTVDDSIRTVTKDSVFTPIVPVDDSSNSSSSSKAEDSDCASPVLTVQSRKHRHRQVRPLIDSDSSDSDVEVYKMSSSNYSVNNKSRKNEVVAERGVHRLSALKHRHCFDLLLNRASPDAVKNSDIKQSLKRGRSEHLQSGDVMKSFSQSPCESLDGNVAEKTDIAGKVAIHSSSLCSVHLHRLQLDDVPSRIMLSQEDKLALSAVSCQTSRVSSDNELLVSRDLIRLCETDVNCGDTVQSSDVHYCSGDDLFSDNELIESVCLSPSRYCNSSEHKDDGVHGVSKLSDRSLESAVTCRQLEVPFVSYSQAEDDCILIDDSDDELFANLTQNDMTIKEEDDQGHQSDDHEECDSTDDDNWLHDDVDNVAAGSRNRVGEMPVACDPWSNDVADVSSDELEEAYNAAMSHAIPAVSTLSASTRQLHRGDDNAVIISDANVKLLNQNANSTCSVLLKPLRKSDIPPEIHFSQEQKHICERDVVVNEESDDDSHSGMSSQSVRSKSISCEVTSDAEHGDRDKAVAVAVDVCKKPDATLQSSDLTGFVDCDKLACSETSTRLSREPDYDAVVVDDRYHSSSKCGVFENINERLSACDIDSMIENVSIKQKSGKRSTSTRVALENCLEVAEFYGTSVTTVSKENKWQKQMSKAVNDMTDADTVTDAKNRHSTGTSCTKTDQSHLTITAPLPVKSQKIDKPGDDSAFEEEEWKSKSSVPGISKNTSSELYRKVAQMHDSSKQKLRKDKASSVSGRQQQSDYGNDRFLGLSQFSVAKQQLVERNRQLKNNGLYYVVCLYCYKISVKYALFKISQFMVVIYHLLVCNLY